MSEPSPFQSRVRAIRERAAGETVMRLMGADLSGLEPGGATVSVGCRPELLAEEGRFHDEVTAILVEQGARIAAATWLGDGEACLQAQCRLNLIAPARGDRLVCRARVVRAGRLASVVAADVVCMRGAEEVPTATAIATVSIVEASALAPAGHA
ncbi:PaaI family thioesterase [Enterovirga aerilata]|uniref:PaaI family thioesterase n=1 Tax=Enterovirga aerilata TaxID=2730920 RepID=A0A849I2K4_9HYPH|nr:PaaI family thioesterase [Enterovirga sp. DB1703]NNM73612.1 PaaI family thioesterase [Enterovirga sp. DB1703]